jgi:MoaA/NifB/PqqE/SkfB family radical SAM enzyme
MANLIISNVCDAACDYCFAASHMTAMRAPSAPAFMSAREFEKALNYLDHSGIEEARLLGGEPTLHPDFPAFVEAAIRRGKRLVIFTHALIPEAALQSLLDLPAEKCCLIVNMSAEFRNSQVGDQQAARRLSILKVLGSRAMPGYNIQSPGFDLSVLIQTARETGMRRTIRLGMALPGPKSSNRFIHPKQYRLVGSQISRQAEQVAREGFTLDVDCGFVRCMFSDAELSSLNHDGAKVGFHCSPILDICPDDRVLHCFSLSDRFVQPFSGRLASPCLHEAFEAQIHGYRTAGVFSDCSTCVHKLNRECSGGCLAATLKRFQPAAFELAIPDNFSL